MPTVPLSEAQARLSELVDHLAPGEELVLTRGDTPVARVVAPAPAVVPDAWVAPRHRDAVPACYAAGSVGGMICYAAGWSPLAGFAAGFAAAAVLAAAVLAVIRPGVEHAGR